MTSTSPLELALLLTQQLSADDLNSAKLDIFQNYTHLQIDHALWFDSHLQQAQNLIGGIPHDDIIQNNVSDWQVSQFKHEYWYNIPVSKTKSLRLGFKQQPNINAELEVLGKIFINLHRVLNLAAIDPLTGLLNRNSLNRKMSEALSNLNQPNRKPENQVSTVCVAMFDIDFFKQVNDKYGHLFGDEVLILFCQSLVKNFRLEDCIFRYGGEEFLVLIKNIAQQDAHHLFEKARKNVETLLVPQIGNITCSIGFTITKQNADASLLIDTADAALYNSKQTGRNKVTFQSFENPNIPFKDDINLF